jgi:hypothetical protein
VFIQQSVQSSVGLTQDIPKKLLADIAIGQRLETTVVKPAVAGEVITIKVADSSVTIRTPVDLQAGQKLQLEVVLEQGKLALKIIPLTQGLKAPLALDSLTKNLPEILNLKAGQQIAVEVVKILAEKRLLVQTSTPNNGSSQIKPTVQQFDVDITQLSKSYKLGDKLTMDIVNTNPLSIQLRAEQPLSREQLIIDRLRQMLPQSLSPAGLDKVLTAVNKQQLPTPVQVAVQQLVANTLDKSAVTEANALKQALSTSGVFTENKLLKMPNAINQDFKINVTRVLNILEEVITQVQTQSDGKPINKLPAQVLSALLSQGKSPAQLLNVLLSGKNPVPNSVAQTVLSAITNQEQATALIQLLTKSLSHQQQAMVTASRQSPLQLSELMALFKEVDSVHKKLQFNQLSMLKEPEASNVAASWLFDLPIKDKHNVDLVQVQIDQQKKQAEHDDESWQVQLCLDTQNLGAVQASVTLHGEDVKVVIRAERAESAQLLEENLPLLNATLAKLNVSISHMSCVCDEVKHHFANNHGPAESTSLVDISV